MSNMPEITTVMLAGHGATPIAADKAGSGPPLLLVHGTSSDRARWTPVIPTLAARFTLYAIDRRGRGASGDETGYDISWEFADMAALVSQLAAAHDQPVHVFGHSYGAFCLLEAGLLTSDFGRIVFYEPPVPLGEPLVSPDVLALLNEAASANDPDRILETVALQVVRYPQAEYEMLQTLPTWQNRRDAAVTIPRELGALNRHAPFDAARFAAYPWSSLLLLGSDSPGFLQDATHMLERNLPGAALHVMAGQQHNAIDAVPDEVARLMVDFLLD